MDVLYLPAHSEQEEDEPVDDEDRPVHGDVEHFKERANDGNERRARRREPIDQQCCQTGDNMLSQAGEKAHQNCHSGSRRTKGLNSSSRWEGRGDAAPSAPSSRSSARRSSCSEGSNLGCRKARSRLRR